MAIRIGSTIVIDNSKNLTNIGSITGNSIDVAGNADANAFRINGTTVINSSRAITATSIDVSSNSDANQFRINGTAVVNSSRNLVGLGTGSGALALTGTTLALTIGGAQQDTQDLSSIVANVTKTYTFYDQEHSGGSEFYSLGNHDFCSQSGWTHTMTHGSSWVKCRVFPLLDGGSCSSSGVNYPENGDTATGTNYTWCMSYGSQDSASGDDSTDCRATCIDF